VSVDLGLIAYVRAAAAVLALPLDDDRVQRVAMHLARTAEMAHQLDAFPLAPGDEPAAIYHPGPFPAGGEHR
jgi:hypothetical protein